MHERTATIEELAKFSSHFSRKKHNQHNPVRKAFVKSMFTHSFFVDEGSMGREILFDEKRDWVYPEWGPTENVLFSQVAAPELTSFGQFIHGTAIPLLEKIATIGAILIPRSREEEQLSQMIYRTATSIARLNSEAKKGTRRVIRLDAKE